MEQEILAQPNVVDEGKSAELPLKPPKKRMNASVREEIVGTALASIPLIGFAIFALVPLVMALAMAFFRMKGFGFEGAKWIGFGNFSEIFHDIVFWKSIWNTIIFALGTLISQVLALLVAYFLSKDVKGKKAFRMIYFMPYVCSVVAITLMWKTIFNTNFGILNQILGRSGNNAINWFSPTLYRPTVIFMGVWSGMGYGILLYTAALTNVNQACVEAAKIDGANAFRVFWSVVLPSISPTSFYLLVTGIIGALQAFAVQNLIGISPDNQDVTIVYYMYMRMFNATGKMGVASASAFVLAIIILIVTVVQFLVSKYWVKEDV